ncbi:MAG: tripartite tricarboxylate transporter substrate binding protein [Alphaproteobacteria bacterium]|nr:tripartite tricarboxylate transporter substrate binding protein [Alphaproteobacteria bacterium]
MTSRRAVLASLAATPALAQPSGWPDRPIRMIVPAAGGAGTADTIARILAQEYDKRLPQRVVVDNRAGANGNVGAGLAARAAPDGYTMLYSWAGTLATHPAMYRDLPFDPLRDFEPVVMIGNVPNILVVNNALGVRNLADFTALVRARPGALSFGPSGNGSSMHLAGELYRQATGTEMVHVPYVGIAQGFNDLFAGRIEVMFNLITGAAPQVRAGQVTPIAVLSDRRAAALPDVPTMAELGMPGLVFGTWFCLMFPRGTPASIIATMNRITNEILVDAEARPRLEAQGLEIMGGTPQGVTDQLTAELRRHAELVRFSGARME